MKYRELDNLSPEQIQIVEEYIDFKYRRYRNYPVFVLLPVVLAAAYLVFRAFTDFGANPLQWSLDPWVQLFALIVFAYLFALVMPNRRSKELKQVAYSLGYLPKYCFDCSYNLENLNNPMYCPECGTKVQRLWQPLAHWVNESEDRERPSVLMQVVTREETNSTNELATRLLNSGELTDDTLVLALRQTAGRGQGRNRWYSDDYSLTVSFVVDGVAKPNILPLLIGLAVREVVATAAGPSRKAEVKWPNDVWLDGKKVAGILCQRVEGKDIIGIGINVATNFDDAPDDVKQSATAITDDPEKLEQVLVALCRAVPAWLRRDNWRGENSWLEAWREHDALRDKQIVIQQDIGSLAGLYKGVDEEGRLLLDDGKQLHKVTEGRRVRLAKAT